MMVASGRTTIEVDAQVAEIIRQADARARSLGESLGVYLQHALRDSAHGQTPRPSQSAAWDAFVKGMISHAQIIMPQGFVADDSRDAMYDDRA